jgi:hypothetical protein
MRRSGVLFVALGLALSARAQAPADSYSPEQLDQLVGPIALYPDPLVALILPASTVPSDVSLAAEYLASNGDPAGIDSQPWDPSVRGLAHYPDVVKWMAGNLDWTQALGAAFVQQPADVMKSIQQLRAQALAAGTLVNTPQQQIDVEGDDIRIVPTQPDVIYVPDYDPDVVYDVPTGYTGSFVTFGPGFPVGPWLGYECDWDDFGIWVGPWQRGWAYRQDWRTGAGGNAWRPDPGRAAPVVRNFYRPGSSPPHPGPIARAPAAMGRPSVAPRAPVAIPSSRPDYRGRPESEAPRPVTPAPASSLFGGYNRGTETRDFSNRGQASRQAPVRSPARVEAPARAAPAGGGEHDRR